MAEPAHENPELDVRRVLVAGAAIVVAVIVAIVGSWAFVAAEGGTVSAAHAPPAQLQPRPEARPLEDLATFRKEEAAKTARYAWVDEQAGIVQIPVTHAMDLLIERRGSGQDVDQGRAGTAEAPDARR